MEEFDALIKELAEKRIDRDVPNSTAEHALIGIKYLFRYAEGTVRVITKSLNVTFWKKLETEIVEFLDRKTTTNTLEIISLESLKDNVVAELLRQRYSTRVSFYVLDWQKTKFFKSREEVPNFVVVDPVGYRIEEADAQLSEAKVTGYMNYGDESKTELVKKVFDKLKNSSQKAA